MMNRIFGAMILIGIITGILTGGGDAAVNSMITGMGEAVTLTLGLSGAFMFWMGMMEVAKDIGLIEKLANIMRPFIKKLFPKAGDAGAQITLNLAANFFGMGSAATPFGLSAMKELEKNNPTPTVATDDMCMFIALNASALELLPTGVIALRASSGSSDPYAVIVPTFIASLISFISAIILAKAFKRAGQRRARG